MTARALIESLIESDFSSWFAGSKVVDSNGNPLRVYHGTAPTGWAFKPGVGIEFYGTNFDRFNGPSYFASNPDYAAGFAQAQANERALGNGARMMPVFLSIKNPADMRSDATYWRKLRDKTSAEVSRLKSMGHDGILMSEVDPSTHPHLAGHVWFAFEPDQIRSAVGSRSRQ